MSGTHLTEPTTQLNTTSSIPSDILRRAKSKNYGEHCAKKMMKMSTSWRSDFLELKPNTL